MSILIGKLDRHTSIKRLVLYCLQEAKQRDAFECLQQQRDLKRQRIVGDIRQVEEELCRLTRAEQERRASEGAISMAEFAKRRKDLVTLLARLQVQKQNRDSELRLRLVCPFDSLIFTSQVQKIPETSECFY